jgi:hypothetical protein
MQLQVVTEEPHDIPWMMESPFAASDDRHTAQVTSNIRAVGFIANPERVNDLTVCMKGPLMKLLRGVPGFAGAMILHSHKESRSVMIFTFWQNETQAMRTSWENFASVRNLLSPLVDLCTKVQTFRGTSSETNGRSAERVSA